MIHQYPKQSKYRKTTHKHIIKTDFKKANTNLLRGMFGIKTLTGGNLLFKQIETARRKIVKGQRDKMKT
jgi:ribosomal protein L16/L10AE